MNPKDQAQLWREVMHAGELLKSSTGCRKINIGALGNVVAQLHVHVIARNPQDAAGLAPVWGNGAPERYAPAALEAQVQRFREILHPPSD
jgi:diadenosine tetraphosphate (Ap4A) HIT family hydrolase